MYCSQVHSICYLPNTTKISNLYQKHYSSSIITSTTRKGKKTGKNCQQDKPPPLSHSLQDDNQHSHIFINQNLGENWAIQSRIRKQTSKRKVKYKFSLWNETHECQNNEDWGKIRKRFQQPSPRKKNEEERNWISKQASQSLEWTSFSTNGKLRR